MKTHFYTYNFNTYFYIENHKQMLSITIIVKCQLTKYWVQVLRWLEFKSRINCPRCNKLFLHSDTSCRPASVMSIKTLTVSLSVSCYRPYIIFMFYGNQWRCSFSLYSKEYFNSTANPFELLKWIIINWHPALPHLAQKQYIVCLIITK